eukprot:scaffold457366_cov36-Prasinocladus_malaysianus.AAC.1
MAPRMVHRAAALELLTAFASACFARTARIALAMPPATMSSTSTMAANPSCFRFREVDSTDL